MRVLDEAGSCKCRQSSGTRRRRQSAVPQLQAADGPHSRTVFLARPLQPKAQRRSPSPAPPWHV